MEITKIGILAFIFGTLSNQVGGFFGFLGKSNNKSIYKTVGFTAGITTAIICFELLTQSFSLASKYHAIIFTILGVLFVKILDFIINIINKTSMSSDSLVIVSAMSSHNITEGIAIGSAFSISFSLGMSLIFAIMIHNIPEGMIIGSMLKKEKKQFSLVLYNCLIIGIFLGIGAIIGGILGNINNSYIMVNLALSAGAMLYMLACDLIPSMYNEYDNKNVGVIYILGFLIGCLICKL